MDQAITQMLAGLDGNILALRTTIFQYQVDLDIASSSSGNADVDQQLMQESVGLKTQLVKLNHRLKGYMEARAKLLEDNPG